jgi:TonB family protein
MTGPLSQTSGEIPPAEGDYFDWSPEGSPVSIQVHLDVIDGIVRDVAEQGGIEIGGLLLGKVESGGHPSIRIERCQRIPCEHRFGPPFILDQEDQAGLVAAAEQILKTSDLSVVGMYRSHARPGFQLEMADFELIARYFSDPSDLMLLVKAESMTDISARFFAREREGATQPVGPIFPFRGHAPNPPVAPLPDLTPDTPERPRRLVPDFVPSVVEPSRTPRPEPAILTATSATGRRERNWWPLLAAIFLVCGGAWFFLQPKLHLSSASAPIVATPAADRPLGLYVDPAGETWRVSWNPNATALRDARTVQLFVREGDDQNRVDLSPGDLAAGMYQYRPAGNDVTFRLEVTENSGHVSAESFRLDRAAAPVAAPAAAPPPSPAPAVAARITEPRAIRRVPPVVPVSIKPRINGTIPIDVRVRIDAEGRVTSATPVVKQPSGLHAYLAGRAVEAARLWRFEPARENGKPVPGTETIHFVFEN